MIKIEGLSRLSIFGIASEEGVNKSGATNTSASDHPLTFIPNFPPAPIAEVAHTVPLTGIKSYSIPLCRPSFHSNRGTIDICKSLHR
mmetsp:Transcript_15271/g.20226  ORF Transcript_15271/g.20226 Transcript_15271/m.20226 type:complete len:87 (+) Transcript_15271:931-1191(+)